MRAPTTSWWWKLTPPGPIERVLGLPTSWSSAARRTAQLRRRVLDDGDRVRQDVLVRVDRVLLEPHRVELGQELVGEARLARAARGPRSGRRPRAGFDSSSRMRSALTISSRCGASLDRRRPARDRARARAPRRSAPRAASAAGRRRTTRRAPAACAGRARRGRPRHRGDRRDGARGGASAIAFTVKSRRARSCSMSSANVTSGLRLSGR